jgi:3-hydroxybutyryl-CoA dehydrogenase
MAEVESARDASPHGEAIDEIAVIGAGQMGNGIAHVFAAAGYDVAMIDVADAA